MKIETDRLIIRYFQESDAEDLYDYLSREIVVRYEPYAPFTREEAIQEAKRRSTDHDFYAIALKNRKVIGNLYLAPGEYDAWEIGFVFHNDYWGKGYAYESVHALLDYAFQELKARRIVAMCNPLNERSRHLLERLKFRREGTFIKNIYFFTDEVGNPIWQDSFSYALLKDEF